MKNIFDGNLIWIATRVGMCTSVYHGRMEKTKRSIFNGLPVSVVAYWRGRRVEGGKLFCDVPAAYGAGKTIFE